MAAGDDFLQQRCNRLSRAWPCRSDRRDAEGVHKIDHRDRSVCFGKGRRDRRKGAGAQTRTAKIRREREREQPRLAQRVDSLGRESSRLVIGSRRRRQHATSDLPGPQNRLIVSHNLTVTRESAWPIQDCPRGWRRGQTVFADPPARTGWVYEMRALVKPL